MGGRTGWRRSDRWKRERSENRDVHKEIKNTISHESFHVPVRLPLLRCFVHVNRLLQCLNDSKNQKRSTENESWDNVKHHRNEWRVAPGAIANREINELYDCDWCEGRQGMKGNLGEIGGTHRNYAGHT